MNDSDFIKACYGQPVEKIPVWFMRQAGRSLPGYRKLRETYDVLTLTQTPELAAEVSMEPVERLGVDAAILFADIMLLPIAMGVDVKILEGIGPVIDKPINVPEDLSSLKPFEEKNIEFLKETIRILRSKLTIPLIGFSGAPFTLASYLIEGKPSRTWTKTKRFMIEHPESWNALMSILSDGIIDYLKAQIKAGAQAVQLFDSWVGCLSPADYQTYVLPHVQRIFSSLKDQEVPRIHFGTDTAGIFEHFSNVDCEVVGADWRISLKDAKARAHGKSIQGNLDPVSVLGSWESLTKKVDAMLAEIDPKKGYIFNFGHGVLPESDDAVIRKLVEYVHSK